MYKENKVYSQQSQACRVRSSYPQDKIGQKRTWGSLETQVKNSNTETMTSSSLNQHRVSLLDSEWWLGNLVAELNRINQEGSLGNSVERRESQGNYTPHLFITGASGSQHDTFSGTQYNYRGKSRTGGKGPDPNLQADRVIWDGQLILQSQAPMEPGLAKKGLRKCYILIDCWCWAQQTFFQHYSVPQTWIWFRER